jgi:FkbM family methyltransferase
MRSELSFVAPVSTDLSRMRGWGVDLRRQRQSWFGLKRSAKGFLSLGVPHAVLRFLARFVPVLRSGRLPAPADLEEVEGRVAGATFVMLDPARCENAKQLYWGHGRRPMADDRLALDTVVALARQADVFLDIGAYTGLFTLAVSAVAPAVQVHAFEIVPAVADALVANLVRNRVDLRVAVHREGVGEDGKTMRVPTGEGGSALPSFFSSRMRFDEGDLVSFRSLDSVAEMLPDGDRVVIKIDVEGTEDAVLGSGQAFLESFRPDILCEVLPEADGAFLEALITPPALRPFLVTGSKLEERPRIEPDAEHRDWLFTAKSPDELRALGLPVG